jgi:signal transduction histidine kinase
VLKVIASSPSNLQPVFDAIADRSKALINGHSTTVFRFAGDMVELVAATSVDPAADAVLRATFPMPVSLMSNIENVLRGEISEIVDALADTEPDASKNVARARGWRSRLVVPLKGDNEVIGFISMTRKETGGFAGKDVELVRTFADQAVIAIQNVELFDEVQARTRDLTESLQQQTATSEVLQIISSSPGDLSPVFNKMLENATRICGANFGTMLLCEDDGFRTVALYHAPKAYTDTQLYRMFRPHPESGLSAIRKSRVPIHIADLRAEPPYVAGDAHVRALADLGGARTLVIVPMLKENELVGAITIYRQEVKPFTDKQTDLVSNFAKQAVIAIENTRLLNELRDRTAELSRSLEDLRAAQDRLIQTEKLASLGQLTAGIAHEIKNPLNFVNNFSALSAELVDEMTDVFQNSALDETSRRKELDDIRELLKSNLEKVVQHGKRADSIVKNMLLHSREGSGELRAADVNALVEESLNLAYHGARAEKSGFNITLQREFDASAGSAELFPQEITRALLNLISNGFYAATKRKSENDKAGFEPTLSATTRNLGASVEIRIRDNGTGIPPEVKEKMFNPFFTTKPAGEGTGLGLSMTHDIIVKQHGGTIRAETEPGVFTEFIVTLPRASGIQSIQRST